MHRYGAWELLPRPPTEDERLKAFGQIAQEKLKAEQKRLNEHLARFRLHTRSPRQIKLQFDKLRQDWFTLPPTSTG